MYFVIKKSKREKVKFDVKLSLDTKIEFFLFKLRKLVLQVLKSL
jgi:hypothetical protein